jgi:succinylarginine dihydrolase
MRSGIEKRKRDNYRSLYKGILYLIFQAVTKDLLVASKLKSCPSLQLWIRSIANTLWWSFDHCQGTVHLTVGKVQNSWIQTLHHENNARQLSLMNAKIHLLSKGIV